MDLKIPWPLFSRKEAIPPFGKGRHINDSDRKGLKDNIRAFSDILDADAGGRVKVVVSASDACIDAFRERNGKKYPTGLSNSKYWTRESTAS